MFGTKRSPNQFGRSARLTKTDEFSSVFAFRRQKRLQYLQVLCLPRPGHPARLGAVVSKKIANRAHDRNYMKRVIRETFRLHQTEYAGFDIVVRVVARFSTANYQQAAIEQKQLIGLLCSPAKPVKHDS